MGSSATHERVAVPEAAVTEEVRGTVVVPCHLGLHLRVMARLVATAKRFTADTYFCIGRRCADAKSILTMLQLGAQRGKRLTLIARGPDAARAAQALLDLFASKDILCYGAPSSGGDAP